jgi:hypothetical protein
MKWFDNVKLSYVISKATIKIDVLSSRDDDN